MRVQGTYLARDLVVRWNINIAICHLVFPDIGGLLFALAKAGVVDLDVVELLDGFVCRGTRVSRRSNEKHGKAGF